MAVVAVVAAAALAAILWYWPRLAGRGVLPVVARIGALGVLQLSVLGLIFLIVNSSAEFYSSWSDLLGDQSGGGAIVARQAEGGGRPAADGPAARPALRDQRGGIRVPAARIRDPGPDRAAGHGGDLR